MSRRTKDVARRSNQEWLLALRSSNRAQSELAYRDLAAYLYKVASNYLERRQGEENPRILATFTSEQLEALAQNFVQDTFEKMLKDNFALLDRFEGRGAFTSWMAVIVIHQIAAEFRRAEWDRRVSAGRDDAQILSFFEHQEYPKGLEEQELGEAMQNCLCKLTKNRRLAILRRVVEGHSVEEVARQMNKTKRSVYSLVFQAKRDLQKCLQKAGLFTED